MKSRIEDLEIRFAHQEHSIEQLSEQIRQQYQVIDDLRAQVRYLHTRLEALGHAAVASPAEEGPPPHY